MTALKGRDLARFLNSPPAHVRLALFYGPDAGLVRTRARDLCAQVVDDPRDPFRIATIDEETLRRTPGVLVQEAAAVAMLGGRRVVRVRLSGERAAGAVTAFLARPQGAALVIVEAGDLRPRSALRQAAVKSEAAAVVACYGDDARALETLVTTTLARQGLELAPDAFAAFVALLGADRALSLQELEKLAVYMGPDSAHPDPARPNAAGAHGAPEAAPARRRLRMITADDVAAISGDASAFHADDVAHAAASGDAPGLGRALARARAAGLAPVSLLAGMARHLQQLHWAVSRLGAGATAEEAVDALRPPVHFSRRAALRRQMRLWTRRRLDRALQMAADAEAACKQTGTPAQALCGQALLRIAAAARR